MTLKRCTLSDPESLGKLGNLPVRVVGEHVSFDSEGSTRETWVRIAELRSLIDAIDDTRAQ